MDRICKIDKIPEKDSDESYNEGIVNGGWMGMHGDEEKSFVAKRQSPGVRWMRFAGRISFGGNRRFVARFRHR